MDSWEAFEKQITKKYLHRCAYIVRARCGYTVELEDVKQEILLEAWYRLRKAKHPECCVKNAVRQGMTTVIRSARTGKNRFYKQFSDGNVEAVPSPSDIARVETVLLITAIQTYVQHSFTRRYSTIFHLKRLGYSSVQIGSKLGVTSRTVTRDFNRMVLDIRRVWK